MIVAATLPMPDAGNGIAAFQVLDAGAAAPDMSGNRASHAPRME